jgi:histo-blood group ABO system transferase
LLIIATNKYVDFLQPLIESADKFLLKRYDVTYFIFTNKDIKVETNRKVEYINVNHRKWPWMTLGRYKIFSDNSDELSKMDFLYYCDVDMKFINYVDGEIFGERVATQHPGYYGQRGTPEKRPESLAYVDVDEEMQYFAGGFNGGTSYEYLKMSKQLSDNIDIDYDNGIIATWHDESHINRYLIDNEPTKILHPGYCFGQSMKLPFFPKLIALDKHNFYEIRN